MPAGMRSTIPAKMINEIPLPIPRSVICSPSHITNSVPVVRVSTVVRKNMGDGSITMGTLPGVGMCDSAMVSPKLWNAASTSVKTRVI